MTLKEKNPVLLLLSHIYVCILRVRVCVTFLIIKFENFENVWSMHVRTLA